jgi:hypothetical protein
VDKAVEEIRRLAELIGPNAYLQALAIAVVFIMIGKIADWILSRAIGKIASRSRTDVDDRIISLSHQPIFMSFVLIGLGLATQRLELADPPTFITLGILKTFAVVIWYNMLRQLTYRWPGAQLRSEGYVIQFVRGRVDRHGRPLQDR